MRLLVTVFLAAGFISHHYEGVFGTQILSKSKLEKCEKGSGSDDLNCTNKVVINMAVPSDSSGGEASIMAQLVEVEENSTSEMRALRMPPVITVNKSAAYALFELTYIRDVAYKPEEFFVQTRKCMSDAGAHVVKNCERLRDGEGHIIENTKPTCCPCGDQRRVPSSCGDFFDKMMKGKANTAHCLRYPGDWFHVFGIGQRSLGFSIKIEVKTASKISEVIVGPDNRTVISQDNFLRANLIGDYAGYTNIPSFEEYYLVIPRLGGPGQPQDLGKNYSMWMLLERVRFTLDGLECNKIGVGYEAFNGQPDFCSSPFWSCLHNQLWNFWETDMNRMGRNQTPLYVVEGRFQRINQHPNSGSHSFSIGITEVLNTNLLIELSADDIEYVYQRSPGEIVGLTVPTFEALTQFGTATITTKNIGEVEASYSLTFDCSGGVSQMEEQFYILKPKEIHAQPFKLYPTTDQAAKYVCTAILKDSTFKEVDRAECQFTTTATIIDNGTQIAFQPPDMGMHGFFGSIESFLSNFWGGIADFITGKTCRRKCSGFFDFSCHIQYICMSWVIMFGLLLAIFPAGFYLRHKSMTSLTVFYLHKQAKFLIYFVLGVTVVVLLWLLHQKGVFDPFYDWWEDHFLEDEPIYGTKKKNGHHIDVTKHLIKKHHKHDTHKRRRNIHCEHGHKHSVHADDYHYYLHQVHKNKHKHGKNKGSAILPQITKGYGEDEHIGHRRRKRERETIEGLTHFDSVNQEGHHKHTHVHLGEKHQKLQVKQRV